MNEYAMKPTFIDRKGYLRWRGMWAATYKRLSSDILKRKYLAKQYQRDFEHYAAALESNPDLITPTMSANSNKLADLQYELLRYRVVAKKMMTMLKEAVARKDRILKMQQDIREQPFPIELINCDRVDFHFNKIALEFSFIPNWIIKTKGKTFYIHNLNSNVGFSTRNRETGQSKGELRFKHVNVNIDSDGIATIF